MGKALIYKQILLTNSSRKLMYGDQSGEFCIWILGLTGLKQKYCKTLGSLCKMASGLT